MDRGNLGKRVRALRTDRDLSQEALAREAGVSLNLVNKLERSVVTDPHYSTLSGIARALGVPVEELMREPVPLDETPQETGPEKRLSEEAGEERDPDDEVTRRRFYSGLAEARALLLESTAELWDRLLDRGEDNVDTLRLMEHVTTKEVINHALDEEEIKERCAPEQRDQLARSEQRLLEADRRVSRAIDAKLPSLEIDKRRAARAERQAMFERLNSPEVRGL
jgi:transcriptional regulator with XRE-family HTH domain